MLKNSLRTGEICLFWKIRLCSFSRAEVSRTGRSGYLQDPGLFFTWEVKARCVRLLMGRKQPTCLSGSIFRSLEGFEGWNSLMKDSWLGRRLEQCLDFACVGMAEVWAQSSGEAASVSAACCLLLPQPLLYLGMSYTGVSSSFACWALGSSFCSWWLSGLLIFLAAASAVINLNGLWQVLKMVFGVCAQQ